MCQRAESPKTFSDVCRPANPSSKDQRVAIGGLTPQVHVHDLVAFCHVKLVQVIPSASASRAPNRSRFASLT